MKLVLPSKSSIRPDISDVNSNPSLPTEGRERSIYDAFIDADSSSRYAEDGDSIYHFLADAGIDTTAIKDMRKELKTKKVSRTRLLKVFKAVRELYNIPDTEITSTKGVGENSIETRANLPDYLLMSLNNSNNFSFSDLVTDLRIGMSDYIAPVYEELGLIVTLHVREQLKRTEAGKLLIQYQNKFIEQTRSLIDAYSSLQLDMEHEEPLTLALKILNRRECLMAQQIFGVPFTYNLLMAGHHFKYEEKGPLPSMLEGQLSELEEAAAVLSALPFLKAVPSAPEDVKLPMGTSQGLVLKSKKDGLFFRGYSKLILAILASQCTSRVELDEKLSAICEPLTRRGFKDVSKDAFLGIRRMHMKRGRGEPLFMTDSSAKIPDLIVEKSQARSRAIFPFSEALKFWYKRLADPVKKKLFQEKGCCSVDTQVILNAQVDMTNLTLASPELIEHFRSTGEWLTAYDLSGYDTTTPRYISDLYNKVMHSLIPGGDKLWADGHNGSGVLFLNSVLHFDGDTKRLSEHCRYDDVDGRSTLSGQADVTLKNNIVHLIIILGWFKRFFSLDRDRLTKFATKLIQEGDFVFEGRRVVFHLHGDDVFIFFSEKASDYKDLSDYLSATGITCGFEDGPLYLKKVVDPRSKKNLVNLGGSLAKNRIGEYHKPFFLTLLLGVIDNIESEWHMDLEPMTNISHERQLAELQIIELICNVCKSDIYVKVASVVSRWDRTFIKNNSIRLRSELSTVLNNMLSKFSPKSVAIRKSLISDMYKSGSKSALIMAEANGLDWDPETDYVDEVIDAVLSYSINDPSNLNLSNTIIDSTRKLLESKGLDRYVEFLASIQEFIVSRDGDAPTERDIEFLINKYNELNE